MGNALIPLTEASLAALPLTAGPRPGEPESDLRRKKGDPGHGKKKFVEPRALRLPGVAVVLERFAGCTHHAATAGAWNPFVTFGQMPTSAPIDQRRSGSSGAPNHPITSP